MKKLIIASLLLFATQGVFAQLDWSKLSEEYSKLYLTAERIAEQTDLVIANETGVGLVRSGGTTTFERQIDLTAAKEHFKYNLVKADGTKVVLDKVLTEKVINAYSSLLGKVKESLKEDRGAKVEEILNSLFQ